MTLLTKIFFCLTFLGGFFPSFWFFPSKAVWILQRSSSTLLFDLKSWGNMDIAVKSNLRRSMRGILKSLSATEIMNRSTALAAQLFNLPAFQNARGLSCFISMPTAEVQTKAILEQIFDRNGSKPRCFIPKVTGGEAQDMVMMELKSTEELINFPANKWGIPEPPYTEPDYTFEGIIDLVLVPGVAFDQQCNRLGHGKGYYDCFLQRINDYHTERGLKVPTTVGLCFDEQMLQKGNTVPTGEFDIQLDHVVTPSVVYTAIPTASCDRVVKKESHVTEKQEEVFA